jgi:hypothetical protein
MYEWRFAIPNYIHNSRKSIVMFNLLTIYAVSGSITMRIIFLLLLLSGTVYGQDTLRFQEQQRAINQKGMAVLGSWAIGNMAVGFAGASRQQGVAGYRSQMNGIFNVVNLGLALPAFIKATRPLVLKPQTQAINSNIHLEKVLLFNAGFDFAYIATGFYLQERGRNATINANQLKGYGQSLIVQGAFLLAFDATMHYVHTRNRKRVGNWHNL